jgi:hypothetical protein
LQNFFHVASLFFGVTGVSPLAVAPPLA